MSGRNIDPLVICAAFVLVLSAALFPPGVQAAAAHFAASTVVCFTPEEDCTGMITGAINNARSEVLVQAYSFTSRPISRALINAGRRGVHVEIVLDSSFLNEHGKYAAVTAAVDAGIPTFIDSFHAIAHNKIMVIDGQTVITGSFNFTRAAQFDNAENIIVLKSTGLAAIYKRHFLAHRKHSRPYAGKNERKILFKFPYRETAN